MRDHLGYLVGQPSPSKPPVPTLTPSVVSRSDDTGVWVTPVGEDTASPTGPCRGGLVANVVGNPQQGYQRVWDRLAVGTLCLVASTSEGPFIVAF